MHWKGNLASKFQAEKLGMVSLEFPKQPNARTNRQDSYPGLDQDSVRAV